MGYAIGRGAVSSAVPYAVIIIGCILLYGSTLGFSFTYLDDAPLVYDAVKSVAGGWKSLQKIFSESLFPDIGDGYYRPLVRASFLVDAVIGGDRIYVYHATNVALHALSVCLAYACLVALGFGARGSLAAAVYLLSHPLLTQAVAWIPGRAETLCAVGVFAATLCYLRYRSTGSGSFLVLHGVCFLLALLSKETAIVVIPVCLVHGVLFAPRARRWPGAGAAVAWISVLLVWALLRFRAVGCAVPWNLSSAVPIISRIPAACAYYIDKAFFPFDLSVWPTWREIGAVTAPVAVVFAIILLWRTGLGDRRAAVFGLSWFFLFLLPTFVTFTEDRSAVFFTYRAYVPMFGMAAALLSRLGPVRHRFVPCLVASAVALNIIAAAMHTADFADGVHFWASARSSASGPWRTTEAVRRAP